MKGVNIGKSLVQRMNKQLQEYKDKDKSGKEMLMEETKRRILKNGQKNKLSLPSRKSQEDACQASIMTVNWRKVNAGDRSAKLKKARQGDINKVSNGAIVFTKNRPMAFLPRRATKWAAGYDVSPSDKRMTVLEAHKMTELALGWSMRMPKEKYATLTLRSGFHRRHPQLTVVGGVIDSDYEGEVRMMLMNHGDDDIKLMRGFEFAQLLISETRDYTIYERDFDNDEEEAVKTVQIFAERKNWEESKSASETMEYQFDSQQQRADIYGMETELHDLKEVSAEEMMSDQELLSAVEEHDFQEASQSVLKKRLQMECQCKEPIHVIDDDSQLLFAECGRCGYIVREMR